METSYGVGESSQSAGRGGILRRKLSERLLFLRRDLRMHRLIIEGDLFREYLAAAPGWLSANYCLNDMVNRVKAFGFNGYFIDTGWWQLEAVESALAAIGADSALQLFKGARANFDNGLDPDIGAGSIFVEGMAGVHSFCQSIVEKLQSFLVLYEDAIEDWLKLMDTYSVRLLPSSPPAVTGGADWTCGDDAVIGIMPSPYSTHAFGA